MPAATFLSGVRHARIGVAIGQCLQFASFALLVWCVVGWSSPAVAARDLDLATWNLEHLAADNGVGCRPRTSADYHALQTVGLRLDAAIVAVQEVEDAVALARVFNPADHALVISGRADGRSRKCRGKTGQRLTEQRTGFAIQRERLAELGLDYRRREDVRALGVAGRRWGVWIELAEANTGAPVLQLLSVHLKSGCAWNPLDGGQPVRRSQCLVLRRQRGILEEWMDARVANGEPFVVLGDFNRQLDQPKDHFWAEIADGEICQWQADDDLGRRCIPGSEQSARGARLVLAHAGKTFPYPYNRKFPYAIDHLVLDATAGSWVRRRSYRVLNYPDSKAPLSDHHPIGLTLRLP